jgi:hypothetical protein
MPSTSQPDIEDSSTSVFNTIIDRLKASSIPTSGLDKHRLEFALPSSPHHNWSTLLETPILLSDQELTAIIQLTDTTGDQTDCPDGHHVFYLRSFPLKIGQLRALLSLWKKQNNNYPEAAIWEQMTKHITDDSIIVYLRYIGMTSRHSGTERHREDKNIRDSGMFSDFVKACDKIDPSIYFSVKIYHFKKAHLKPAVTKSGSIIPPSQEDADLRERVLIALFGLPSLLNRHIGGWYAVYQPAETDVATFKRLGTSAFTKLMDKSLRSKAPNSLLRRVTNWMQDTLKFAAQHTEELGLEKHTIDDRHKKIWIEQALPTRILGQAVIVVIGDDIPLYALTEPGAFWKQRSRSSHLLRDYLSRLMAYEQRNSDWHTSQLNPVVDAGLLPFFDHRYWPNTTELIKESISLTRSYMEATRPWLSLVLASKNNKLVRSNFAITTYRHIDNLLGELRNFTIQYYTDPGEIITTVGRAPKGSNQVDLDDCFIQLPSFHPGVEKYGAGSTELRRVMDINLWKILLAIDVTLDTLYSAKNNPSFRYSRYDTCQLILRDIERRWKASGADVLFDDAKNAFKPLMDSGDRWHKDITRAFVPSCNGVAVNMTLRGEMTLYWQQSDGKSQKVTIFGGPNIAPNKGEVMQRKIFFTSKGIDIQDDSGKSMTHIQKHTKALYTNPTLPGLVLRKKLFTKDSGIEKVIELWEHETGLVFDEQFPKPLEQTTISNYATPPSFSATTVTPRNNTTVSKKNTRPSEEQATVPKKKIALPHTSAFGTNGTILEQLATAPGRISRPFSHGTSNASFAFGTSRLDYHDFDTGHLSTVSETWSLSLSRQSEQTVFTCTNCDFIQVKCEGGQPCNSCESLHVACYSGHHSRYAAE